MKRILKKIIIFVLIICISFSFFDNRKTASATGLDPTVVSLEFILMMLLGYVANQNDINLPLPNNQEDKYDMFKIAFSLNNLTRLDAIDKNDLYNVNTGKSMLQYIADGGDMSDMDFSEWVTYQEHMEIKAEDLEIVKDGLLEYYDVPELANNIIDDVGGNLVNILSILNTNGYNITENMLKNVESSVFKIDYPYYIVFRKNVSYNNSIDRYTQDIVILATDTIPTFISADSPRGNKLLFDKNIDIIYDGIKIHIESNTNDITLGTKELSVYDSQPSILGEFVSLPLTTSRVNNYEVDNNVLYTNFTLMNQTSIVGFNNLYNLEYIKYSDLSYRTFLASKYGGGALGLEDTDTVDVKLGIIGRVMRHVPELLLDIDNVGATDGVLENLKNIDDFAQENYGEPAIAPTITDVKPIAYPIEYTEILEITDDIDNNFNNSLGAINFDTTDFPDYLLVGLSFVAWLFGQLWLSMGDYSIVLVFVASISLVAVLFGLGLKRDKTGNKSDGGSKSSKTKKK